LADSYILALQYAQIMLFAAFIQAGCVGLAALLRRPTLVALGSAILTAAAAAVGVLILMPEAHGVITAVLFSTLFGAFVYRTTLIAINRGS